ncbi:MAG: hypothetical protein K2O42_02530 [Oscillospiraceae bacterium]|nr:hypothetical protein [Oscillospiraceae bacterium]
MNESEKRKIEMRLEKLESSKSKLDRHELVMDVCIVVLTTLASCVLITEAIVAIAGIVFN